LSSSAEDNLAEDDLKRARFFARQGAAGQARQLYGAVLAREPHNQAAREELTALDARSAEFQTLSALHREGKLQAVLENGERLAGLYPDQAFLFSLMGSAQAGLRQWDGAIVAFGRAVQLRPDIAEGHVNLGKALSEASRAKDAIACFQHALKINPDHGDAHYSLGVALHGEGRLTEALPHLVAAVEHEPNAAQLRNQLGAALSDAGRHAEAVVQFRRALEIKPGVIGTLIHLSIAYEALGRLPEELEVLETLLKIDPGLADVRGRRLFIWETACAWPLLAKEAALFPALGIEGVALQPFVMLALDDDPARNRARAENFVAQRLGGIEAAKIVAPAARPARLRIGYFSADFRGHAVMMQLVRLLELHDRADFEIYAYSYGVAVNDAMRERVKKAVDVFRDVPHLSAQEIAALARADKIDIAVDLMGFTRKARLEIFARRAAPLQVNYLGYPGTMGADFIDYMIADKVIVPDAERAHYREKMIYLPGSHMATDDKRQTGSRTVTRADFGLPENGFVFCCFNNSFKISPDDYDVWMRLLQKVEGSVLWLVDSNIWASANLCHEAAKRGVDPKRLIAAKRVPMADHMARHALADLFLDTCHYTGHATAADALWAGLPLVTRPGRGYHTRVSAGLLTALGLPELIASSSEEYERIALALATDPEKLAAVKAKLAERRKTSPLFESAIFARQIEDGYRKAYARFFDGKPPEDVAVPG